MRKVLFYLIRYSASLTSTICILTALVLTAILNIVASDITALLENYLPAYVTTVQNILNFFGLMYLYDSWWFKTLLVLFSINLLVCTLKRIPQTLRILSLFTSETDSVMPSTFPLKETFTLDKINPNFEHELRIFLSRKIATPSVAHGDGESVYFSQKGRYSHLGFYLAHVGLLIIIIWGISSASSYSGDIFLREGETVDSIFVEKGKNCFIQGLDFSLRLDRCEIRSSAKGDRDKGKTYRSTITLFNEGKKVKSGIIEGLLTFKYKGFRIAQLRSFGKEDVLISLSVTPTKVDGASRTYAVRINEPFRVPETGHTIRVRNILFPDSFHREEGQENVSSISYQRGIKNSFAGMAGLQIYGEDQKLLYTADIYAHKKRHRGPWTDDYTFSLFDIKGGEASAPFSQIKISYEPAGNLIWMSFYITIIGFAMMFLLSHRKLWVKVEEKDGNYHVTLSGWASRNAEVIKHDLKKIKELAC